MGRSGPTRGGKPGIAPEPDDPLLIDFCPDLAEWPRRWRFGDHDLAFGRDLVEALMPFLLHLLHGNLTRNTRNRHRDHLWMLGGEIVRRTYDEPRLRKQLPTALLRRYIDDEGGPLLYPSITEAQQRSFDATCRKLYRYLDEAGDSE